MLMHWVLKSPAWLTMSSNGKSVVIDVWLRHKGYNNGEIPYAVRDGKAIGLSRGTTARALDEAIKRGFLEVTRVSSFTVKSRDAREFRITAEPVGDKPATKDFMSWPKSEHSPTRGTDSPARGT